MENLQVTPEQLFARIGQLTIENQLLQERCSELLAENEQLRTQPAAESKNGQTGVAEIPAKV